MKEPMHVRIKKALKIRNMKQADLVRMTGISSSMISEYVTGKYEPKQDNIYRLSKALNVGEVWLMGLTDDMTRVPDEERQKLSDKTIESAKSNDTFKLSLVNDIEAIKGDIASAIVELVLSFDDETNNELLKRAKELELLKNINK